MNLSPEWQLLLACARANLTADDLRRIAQDLVRPDVDWDHVVKVSYAQGIAPLIYHGLLRSGVTKSLPPAAEQSLRSSYYANAARNSLLYEELGRVLKTFTNASIDVILLKGAALAETVYAHRALRPMADVDLLIRKESLSKVEDIMLAMGYVPDQDKEWFQEHHYVLGFRKSSGIRIEIHWHIVPVSRSSRIDIRGFWERAQSITIDSIAALALSPEDLLLHLCQHACKHTLNGIRSLCDIAEATKFYAKQIDWRKVSTISSQWQITPCVYIALRLAGELLDAPIPESCLKELEPANFNRLMIRWARERLLTNPETSPVFGDLVQLFWKGQDFKERLAVAQKALALKTIARYYRRPAESKRILFYYPQRIGRLLTRHLPVICELMVGNPKIRAAADREKDQLQLTKWLRSSY
jgi:hypothetical protein